NGAAVCSGSPGNICSQTNARGITTTYSYDALNRITQRSYSDGTRTTSYLYDEITNWGLTLTNTKGRPTHISAWDSKSERIFSYDAAGRLIMQGECLPSNCGLSAYITYLTYNPGGQVTSITYPSGRKVSYNYGNAARTSSVVLTQMGATTMNY